MQVSTFWSYLLWLEITFPQKVPRVRNDLLLWFGLSRSWVCLGVYPFPSIFLFPSQPLKKGSLWFRLDKTFGLFSLCVTPEVLPPRMLPRPVSVTPAAKWLDVVSAHQVIDAAFSVKVTIAILDAGHQVFSGTPFWSSMKLFSRKGLLRMIFPSHGWKRRMNSMSVWIWMQHTPLNPWKGVGKWLSVWWKQIRNFAYWICHVMLHRDEQLFSAYPFPSSSMMEFQLC